MMNQKVRWGILGAGRIAGQFARGLAACESGVLTAIGSRSQAKADAFGDEHGIPRRHGSYEALVADGDVDAIYVATPHPMHHPNALLVLRAGKALLCEKPFTVNASQAREVVAAARRAGVFCMEAMWSRFLPSVRQAADLVRQGAIGEVRMIQADFGFRTAVDPEGRLFRPELAGGGLLDVGIYPLSLAAMILGRPQAATGFAQLGSTGVDEQAAFVVKFPGDTLALCATGVRTATPHEATILGADGQIRLTSPWWKGSSLIVSRGGTVETLKPEIVGNGYNYQADEVARCIAAGRTESDVMPLDETVALIETMDQLRAQWHLRYPME
ncbi:MAG: Gfo/Idh/MocA family oxidoreductase [Planctomycetes bacterium]|nr:Gfo/Idh/MocA family oxidoreductase [Planctomycetota bacterium]